MVNPKKIANNILDFLIDPTRIPVQQRLYFRPEEILKNETYENAKAEAVEAFRDQRHNSDFYPNRNRQINKREAMLMDRKSLIASLDILSKNFTENDPIGVDLRTMAMAVSKMKDEEFSKRQASDAPSFDGILVEAAKTFPCPTCGTKVLEQTKYCVKCKKKVKGASEEEPKEVEEKKEEVEASEIQDFWTKEAMNRVAKAIVSDVLGMDESDDEAEEGEAEEKAEKETPKESKETPKEEPKKEMPAEKALEEVKKDEKSGEVSSAEKKVPEEVQPEEEKKSTVNTDILASITFGDITMETPLGVVSSDEVGEMTEEEKAKLAGLFN
jgi:predicted RNA-binding Zn-ribbon protein involved in translation (DUF1610 family)